MNKFKPLIWIEGSISSGKSKMSREVGKRLNYRVLDEPVEGNSVLELFYQDQKRWAFPLQLHFLQIRAALQHLAAWETSIASLYEGCILDRSIAGDRVFAKMHVELGNIHPVEFEIYENAYDVTCRSLLPPTLLVWLDVQPETAMARLQKRARSMEVGVSLDYLVSLRKGYQELLREVEQGMTPWAHAIKVCRIPWDPDTLTEKQWDATTSTIRDACERR